MEKIFKAGDRVFDARCGWGRIISIDSLNKMLSVKFENISLYYYIDGRENKMELIPSLSFTEYDYVNGGFSQERPTDGNIV